MAARRLAFKEPEATLRLRSNLPEAAAGLL
jgi:hypothetical protein